MIGYFGGQKYVSCVHLLSISVFMNCHLRLVGMFTENLISWQRFTQKCICYCSLVKEITKCVLYTISSGNTLKQAQLNNVLSVIVICRQQHLFVQTKCLPQLLKQLPAL